MFEFTLSNGGNPLKKIVEVVKEIVGERKMMFEIGHEGLSLQAVDTARVSIVALYLSKDAFRSFQASVRAFTVCLDPATFLKVLKCAVVEADEEIRLRWDGPPSTHVVLGTRNGCLFNIPMVETAENEVMHFELPDFRGELMFDSSEMARYMKDLSGLADETVLELGTDALHMEVANETGMRARLTLRALLKDTPKSGGDVVGTFALSYLTTMLKAASLSPRLTLDLETDMPLAIHLPLWDGHGHLRLYLAPKITDDDHNHH